LGAFQLLKWDVMGVAGKLLASYLGYCSPHSHCRLAP